MENRLVLSTLNHTWILDLDGTIVKHNGYIIDGCDTLIPESKIFLNSIPVDDMIIFVTSRTDQYRDLTEKFLRENGIRYDAIIYNAPYGERILINDNKPSGLEMTKGISVKRDEGISLKVYLDEKL